MFGMGNSKSLHSIRVEANDPEGKARVAKIRERLAEAGRRSGEPAPPARYLLTNGYDGQEVHTWEIYSRAVLDEFEKLGGEN